MAIAKPELTHALLTVFIQRGYDGATLVHLAQATGLSKASLYHHFPGGKPEMAAMLVRHAIAEQQRLAYSQLGDLDNPTRAISRFIQGFARYVDNGRSNCWLSILSHHNSAHSEIEPLRAQIATQLQDWHARLEATFQATGAKPKQAARQAHTLLGALYGALLTAKMHNDPKLFTKQIKRLADHYERSTHA